MASRADDEQPSSSPDHLDTALEASCEALFALQLIRSLVSDEEPLRAYVLRVIESLRRVIRELRIARGQRPDFFAFAFVVSGRVAGLPTPVAEPDQSKP